MAEQSYDMIVIGAGPGGYVCAIRAAQLGMKAACIEQMDQPGGTCLNIGCIPSKALLHASHLYAHGSDLAVFGIKAPPPQLDLAAMMKFKQDGVEANTKGVAFLLKKNKVEYIPGSARLKGGGKVEVQGQSQTQSQTQIFSAKHIVIATGSIPAAPPGIQIDEKNILSSTGALSLDKVPEHLVVIGAGYIGLEMGSVWLRLGAKVSVIEMLPNILPGMDQEIAKAALNLFKKQGMAFKLSTKTEKINVADGAITLHLTSEKGGGETISADKVLVATGRKPAIDGLDLAAAGVSCDARGAIKVDQNYCAAEGVYALGDVIAGPMLAHKASEEGVALAELLAGQKPAVNYNAIPGVVYTQPEIASVGKSEEMLKEQGIDYRVGKFPFTANGRAKVNHVSEGFVKILADKMTDRILGVHIISAEAGAMIAEAVIAVEFGASSEDIARICHAHPTLSEAMKEAALAVEGRTIHM